MSIEPIEWKKNGVTGTPPIEITRGDEASCLAKFTNPLDTPLDMGIMLWVGREGMSINSGVKRVGVINPGESITAETKPSIIRDVGWGHGPLYGILFIVRGSDVNDRVEVEWFYDIYDYLMPEGFGQISVTTAPPADAHEGDIFTVAGTITNTGEADDIFVQIKDMDTGGIIDTQGWSLAGGASTNWSFNLTMPNKTWNLRLEAGHNE